ncbi:unnamed protein product [Xylocopa violacea]|uniref:Uncharacterized protein n=1 Tax=Xylocopa violacea TaxID=135666 RepID=A0ABP1NU12_XYLVO
MNYSSSVELYCKLKRKSKDVRQEESLTCISNWARIWWRTIRRTSIAHPCTHAIAIKKISIEPSKSSTHDAPDRKQHSTQTNTHRHGPSTLSRSQRITIQIVSTIEVSTNFKGSKKVYWRHSRTQRYLQRYLPKIVVRSQVGMTKRFSRRYHKCRGVRVWTHTHLREPEAALCSLEVLVLIHGVRHRTPLALVVGYHTAYGPSPQPTFVEPSLRAKVDPRRSLVTSFLRLRMSIRLVSMIISGLNRGTLGVHLRMG